jgi:hypothetical protein
MTTTTTKKKTTTTRKTEDYNLPNNPLLFEVFDLVSKQRTADKKVEVLKKYEDPSIKSVLIWNFDETAISALPPGDVPYSSTNEQTSYSGTLSGKITDAVSKMEELSTNSLGSSDQGKSSIRKEYKMFYNFLKGGNKTLSSIRRETMFINILEGLHPKEAEILVLVKDKRLQEKYKITLSNVKDAYPDIKWGGRS